ncbi:MAG: hypothetical protein OXQ94_07285 [Gemmatimonadota bacterium]|nr:hypothetical protein [Gemmatimonadota bacterium]MDE2871478.1 hypothetical protein [Gemmatimonadota bacterium]
MINANRMKHPLRWLPVAASGLCVAAPDLAARQQDIGDTWISHPEFEIGEGPTGTGPAAFGIINTVQLIGDSLLLVTEPLDFRVTIWTPGGRLVAQVGGPGEGPGEFSWTMSVGVHREEFYVIDAVRFTSFSHAGELLGTTPFPPPSLSFRGFGLSPEALLEDGSVLATPSIPPAALRGLEGDDPIEMAPVFRLAAEGGRWRMDTIAMRDIRNRNLSVMGIHGGQIYGDYDLTFFEPVLGTVVVLRRNLGGGLVELVEINADGDTVLQRRVATSPVTMEQDQLESFIDDLAQQYSKWVPPGSSPPYRALRAAIEEAVYIPNPLPGARMVRGTASGEIWFRAIKGVDSHGLWYAVSRDSTASWLRKVLLPPGFTLTDATETHVWGVRRDELGVQYVVGRRLVPLAAAKESPERR